MSLRWWLAAAAGVVAACGGKSVDDEGAEANATGGIVTGRASAAGARSTGGTGGIVSAGDGGGGSGTGGVVVEPEVELPSIQSVVFELHNPGDEMRLVVLGGGDQWGGECSAIGVERIEGDDTTALDMALPRHCGCECPAPMPYANSYAKVGPDETYTMEWDARALATWSTSDDCGTRSGVWQPVTPGRYRITFGVLVDATGCMEGQADCFPSCVEDETTVSCENSPSPSPISNRCGTSEVVAIEITLPAAGDLVVPVEL